MGFWLGIIMCTSSERRLWISPPSARDGEGKKVCKYQGHHESQFYHNFCVGSHLIFSFLEYESLELQGMYRL